MNTLIFLAILWFSVLWAFVAVMHAKARLEELTWFWKVNLAPLALAGIVLDVVFNYTFGWLMFVEWPWDTGATLFSGRVQHHYRHDTGWRLALAAFWARQLNQMDPGHIRQ